MSVSVLRGAFPVNYFQRVLTDDLKNCAYDAILDRDEQTSTICGPMAKTRNVNTHLKLFLRRKQDARLASLLHDIVCLVLQGLYR